MDDMRELITWEQLGVAAVGAAVAVGLGGLLTGLLSRAPDGRSRLVRALTGLAAGPLLFALWRLLAAFTAYHPETGSAGLHRVGTLGLCLLIFVVAGALYGMLIGAAWHRGRGAPPGTEGEAAGSAAVDATGPGAAASPR